MCNVMSRSKQIRVILPVPHFSCIPLQNIIYFDMVWLSFIFHVKYCVGWGVELLYHTPDNLPPNSLKTNALEKQNVVSFPLLRASIHSFTWLSITDLYRLLLPTLVFTKEVIWVWYLGFGYILKCYSCILFEQIIPCIPLYFAINDISSKFRCKIKEISTFTLSSGRLKWFQ